MKVYEYGDQQKPVLLLLPGTFCHYKNNFGQVIEKLTKYYYVACISYSGFDETEPDEFSSVKNEAFQIENYVQKYHNGRVAAAYGCSVGGSIVAIMVARRAIHIEHAILDSCEFAHEERFSGMLKTKSLMARIYPLLHNGDLKDPAGKMLLNSFLKKNGDYGLSLLKALGYHAGMSGAAAGASGAASGMGEATAGTNRAVSQKAGVSAGKSETSENKKTIYSTWESLKEPTSMEFVTKQSIKLQYFTDLITDIPAKISVAGTKVHIFYALQMGEELRERYEKQFRNPDITELNLRQEELLLTKPDEWVELVHKCILQPVPGIEVSKDITIGELLQYDAGFADVLLKSGMHCVGCPSSAGESVELACQVHGIEVEPVVKALQEYQKSAG